MADAKPKIYVLEGFDHNGGFKGENDKWEERANVKGDVVIIRPIHNETMADVAKRITPPARIVINAHGGDGNFTWEEDGKGPDYFGSRYVELFKQLPREGIESITIGGCHGESGLTTLDGVPKGTIVHAFCGGKIVGLGSKAMIAEITAMDEIKPETMALKSFFNLNPDENAKAAKEINAKNSNNEYFELISENPYDALPKYVAVGGYPPVKLDLETHMQALSASMKVPGYKDDDFQRAVKMVKENFSTKDDDRNGFIKAMDGLFGTNKRQQRITDTQIDTIAYKLASGDIQTLSAAEKRIGYALSFAHLAVTGQIDTLVAQQKAAPYMEGKLIDGATDPSKQMIGGSGNDVFIVKGGGKTISVGGGCNTIILDKESGFNNVVNDFNPGRDTIIGPPGCSFTIGSFGATKKRGEAKGDIVIKVSKDDVKIASLLCLGKEGSNFQTGTLIKAETSKVLEQWRQREELEKAAGKISPSAYADPMQKLIKSIVAVGAGDALTLGVMTGSSPSGTALKDAFIPQPAPSTEPSAKHNGI